MASLADLAPLVNELRQAGHSPEAIPGIIQRLYQAGYHQSVPVVTGQVETDREQQALQDAASVQTSRASTGLGLLDDARARSQQLIDLQRDPDNIVSYFAAIAGLPEGSATPVQNLIGQGFRLQPTLPSPYTDPAYTRLRDSLYDFGRPRTVEENVAETARGQQAGLNQFAADQYRKDPSAFLKWTQATKGMASGGQMKIDEPMVAIGTASGQPRFTIGEYGDETMGKNGSGLQVTPLTSAQGSVPGNVQQMMFRMVGLPAQQIQGTVDNMARGKQVVPAYAEGGDLGAFLRAIQGGSAAQQKTLQNIARTNRQMENISMGTQSSPKHQQMAADNMRLFLSMVNEGSVHNPAARSEYTQSLVDAHRAVQPQAARASDLQAARTAARASGQSMTVPAGTTRAGGNPYSVAGSAIPYVQPNGGLPAAPLSASPGGSPIPSPLTLADAGQQTQQEGVNIYGDQQPQTFARRRAAAQPKMPNFAEGGTISPLDASFNALSKMYERNPFVSPEFLQALRNRQAPPPGSITQRFLANTSPSGWQALQAAIRGQIGGTGLDDYLSEVPRFFAKGAPPTTMRYA